MKSLIWLQIGDNVYIKTQLFKSVSGF
jgi:hypothetical protein